MNEKFERLLADIERGYATGLRPARGTFCRKTPDDVVCAGCGLTAAYVSHVGAKTSLNEYAFGRHAETFARKEFGLSPDEVAAFISGFDNEDLDNNGEPPSQEQLTAYTYGKRAAEKWFGEID